MRTLVCKQTHMASAREGGVESGPIEAGVGPPLYSLWTTDQWVQVFLETDLVFHDILV